MGINSDRIKRFGQKVANSNWRKAKPHEHFRVGSKMVAWYGVEDAEGNLRHAEQTTINVAKESEEVKMQRLYGLAQGLNGKLVYVKMLATYTPVETLTLHDFTDPKVSEKKEEE